MQFKEEVMMHYQIKFDQFGEYIEVPQLSELGLTHKFLLAPYNFKNRTGNEIATSIIDAMQSFNLDKTTLTVYTGQQTHSRHVNIIETLTNDEVVDNTVYYEVKDTDGLMTAMNNTVLLSKYADCIPIIIFDAQKKVHANIHSGWRGTLQKIGIHALQLMIEQFDVQVDDLWIVLGPAIGFHEFEVTEEVMRAFDDTFPHIIDQHYKKQDDTHWLIDTKGLYKTLFKQFGIKDDRIIDIDISTPLCPKCHSYRRDKADYQLMGVVSFVGAQEETTS